MPRQGVPYPSREICSLKCQIDALNAKINELMKSINGVQGDGQGNVTLVSGDPAIVINNDQAQHEIEIALDGSQLPAAAVSSVNGQTGAVQLDAGDIPDTYAGDVSSSLNALYLGVNANTSAISAEALARQNADSVLQGNINTVQAGIPAAAAAAVAADPTVIQLATDVPNKLDKITSGSSLKAYTHTGATQGEKSVVDGTTADSIAIRGANGRLQAADPASGATDKTLVTSNWVSQTGDNAPNNLVHRSGTETINGTKIYPDTLVDRTCYIKNTTGVTQPIPIFKLTDAMKNDNYGIMTVFVGSRNAPPYIANIIWNNTTITTTALIGTIANTMSIWKDTDNNYYLCASMAANNAIQAFMLTCLRNAGFISKPLPMNTASTPSLTGWQQVTS